MDERGCYICEVQMRSLVIFEHTWRDDDHGYLGLGVLPTA